MSEIERCVTSMPTHRRFSCFGGGDGCAAAAERIENQVALIAGCFHDALQQGNLVFVLGILAARHGSVERQNIIPNISYMAAVCSFRYRFMRVSMLVSKNRRQTWVVILPSASSFSIVCVKSPALWVTLKPYAISYIMLGRHGLGRYSASRYLSRPSPSIIAVKSLDVFRIVPPY